MNIVIVSAHRFWGIGGMEKVISILVKQLIHYGDTVTLIARKGSNTSGWANEIPYHEICSCGGLKGIFFCWQLTNLLNQIRPDIIIAVDHRAIFYSRLYRWLRSKEVRLGSWMHQTISNFCKSDAARLKTVDFHLTISSGGVKELKKLIFPSANNIYLVYNPVLLGSHLTPRPVTPIFLYIGRLVYDREKNVSEFLRALSHVKGSWKALIIGDGPDRERLKNLAEKLEISDHITWLGWVSEPWTHVQAASVLVLTSKYEGFGLAMVEALSRGIPCISSDCPDGPADIIEHGKNGWFYPSGDISELARLLQTVVDDPELLPDQAMVKETSEKFSSEKIVNNIRDILEGEIKIVRTL